MSGFVSYCLHCVIVTLQICDFLKDGATEVWNQAQKVPYAYKGNQWLGYDNTKSFQIKVTNMYWILNYFAISWGNMLGCTEL